MNTRLPPIVEQPLEWTEAARCLDYDPELMYPYPTDLAWINIAKAICSDCDVTQQCLERAIEIRDDWGVWGGTTPQERARMRRQQRVARRAS